MDSRNLDVVDRLARNWQTALQRVFPAGIPESASWSNREAIVRVLSAIAAPSTGHMFYPDHGGDDLVAAKQSARSEDWVELFSDTSGSWPRIVRPQRLSFICPENCVDMAHFLLASGDISVKPEFPDSCGAFFEEYAEAPSGKKYTHGQWDNDDDGDGGSLPPGTQRILRYWKGSTIAVFAKSSPYNQLNHPSFDAYHAEHLDPNRFPRIVKQLTSLTLGNLRRAG
ncbi:hypothetical protein [Achromobacter denitrificans]|uniref:hypothetical protein n=1 Tax=Achromobacter denitrificans TaxID=32002 RepID=UPI003B9C1BB8